MATTKRKPEAQKLVAIDMADTKAESVTVMVWKALRKLSETEHKNISEKIRFEEARAGIRIVLIPYACELETNGKE